MVGVVGIPILTFILFAGGAYHGIADQPIRVGTQALTAAALVAWLIASAFLPAIRVRSPLAPVAVAMLAVLWASVIASQRPRLSLEAGLTATAVTLGFLAILGIVRDARSRRRLGILVIGAALFVAVGYMVEVGVGWIRFWSFVGRLAVPPLRPGFSGLSLGSPNLIATYLLLLGPLATVLLWRSAGRRFAIPALGLVLVGILLSGSRGGYLGLAMALVFLVPLLLVANAESASGVARRLMSLGSSPRVAMPVIVAIAVGVVALGPALAARFSTGGEALRLGLWQTAVQLFAAHPWFGTGPGTWPQLQLAIPQNQDLVLVVPHPHDAYLRLLSELGIAGVAAALVAFGTLVWRARSALRAHDRWSRIESVAAITGLVGLGTQCLVDDLTNLPAVVLMVALLIGWMDAAVDVAAPRTRLLRALPALPVVLVGVLMIGVPTVVRIDQAALAASGGDKAADAGDWTAATNLYRRAVDLDGDLAFYRIELGLGLAHGGDISGARTQYELALVTDTQAENMIALATLDAADGDLPGAMAHARDATARAGRDVNVFVNAGRVAEQSGDVNAATRWYARAIVISPAVAASPSLAVDGAVRTAAIQVAAADQVALGDLGGAATIAAYGGDAASAQAFLARMPASATRELLSFVVTWLAGDRTGAEEALRARLAANPLDFDAAGWLARFLSVAGDPAAATYRDWTDALRGDAAPEVVYEYSRIPGVGIDRALSRWSGYSAAIYLRDGPLDLLPPQAIVVGINRGG